jgi:hypothetical protein
MHLGLARCALVAGLAAADYRLEVILAAAPNAAAAPTIDARVGGTGFHATGNIRCAMGHGQPAASCSFGVRRGGNGNAMIIIIRPDGFRRVIFFEKGQAVSYDQIQADIGPFKTWRQGDTTTVQIGTERYEIPDAVIKGS